MKLLERDDQIVKLRTSLNSARESLNKYRRKYKRLKMNAATDTSYNLRQTKKQSELQIERYT
jgi:hypothetical protein